MVVQTDHPPNEGTNMTFTTMFPQEVSCSFINSNTHFFANVAHLIACLVVPIPNRCGKLFACMSIISEEDRQNAPFLVGETGSKLLNIILGFNHVGEVVCVLTVFRSIGARIIRPLHGTYVTSEKGCHSLW